MFLNLLEATGNFFSEQWKREREKLLFEVILAKSSGTLVRMSTVASSLSLKGDRHAGQQVRRFQQ